MTLRTNMNAFIHGEEPVFLKEDNSAEQQLADLRALYAEARGAGAPKELLVDIERDGKLVDYGIAGEQQLAFELANSQQLQRLMELVKQIGAETPAKCLVSSNRPSAATGLRESVIKPVSYRLKTRARPFRLSRVDSGYISTTAEMMTIRVRFERRVPAACALASCDDFTPGVCSGCVPEVCVGTSARTSAPSRSKVRHRYI